MFRRLFLVQLNLLALGQRTIHVTRTLRKERLGLVGLRFRIATFAD